MWSLQVLFTVIFHIWSVFTLRPNAFSSRLHWLISESGRHSCLKFVRVRIRGLWVCSCQSLNLGLSSLDLVNVHVRILRNVRGSTQFSRPFWSSLVLLLIFVVKLPSIDSRMDRRLLSVSYQLSAVQVLVDLIHLSLWISAVNFRISWIS